MNSQSSSTKKEQVFYLFGAAILAISFTITICANSVFAANCGGADTNFLECGADEGGPWHIISLVLDIVSLGVAILGVIAIVAVGIQYMSAGSNTAQAQKAKTRIKELIIGLAAYSTLFTFIEWIMPGGIIGPESEFARMGSTNQVEEIRGKQQAAIEKGDKMRGYTFDDEGAGGGGVSGSGSSNEVSTTGDQSNEKLKNKKQGPREETEEIIGERNKDFFYTGEKSYSKVVLDKNGKYGSYKKYVKSLGGVFEQFADKDRITVKTAADFQAAAEYVFGLWEIWGPDYRNGSERRPNWRDADAFYHGYSGRNSANSWSGNSKGINGVLSKSNSSTINTHCNNSAHVFMKSTNLKFINTGAGKSNIKDKLKEKGYNSSKFITKVTDFKVGDVVNMEMCGSSGGHVALVGEVYKDYIVMYDGGSRWQSGYNYKITIKREDQSNDRLPGTYSSYCHWYAFRPWKIDQSETLGGLN